ncbi:MAG: hypothetical protein U0L09_02940, partial [Christensenellales bacterium]|nr:hypothetical protein [Christensenellales bacterium]
MLSKKVVAIAVAIFMVLQMCCVPVFAEEKQSVRLLTWEETGNVVSGTEVDNVFGNTYGYSWDGCWEKLYKSSIHSVKSQDKYQVLYQFAEGTSIPEGIPVPETDFYVEGTEVFLPVPVEVEGYIFAGWTTDDIEMTDGESFVMPAHDLVFTCEWKNAEEAVVEEAVVEEAVVEEAVGEEEVVVDNVGVDYCATDN